MAGGKPKYLGMKILVAVLGIAIIVCFSIIVVELTRRIIAASENQGSEAVVETQNSVATGRSTAETVPVSIQAGEITVALTGAASVIQTYPLAGHLAVEAETSNGETIIFLVDLSAGVVKSIIRLRLTEP